MTAERSEASDSQLAAAPIIEAVVDVDCDVPPFAETDALDAAAQQALAPEYPTARRRLLSQHEISSAPGQTTAVVSRHALQALQYFSVDEKQLIQFRPTGYSFNRLAPYTSLDDYLPEIERTWKLYVELVRPVVCRMVRLRYINRIALPLVDGRVELGDYLMLAPQLADKARLTFNGFFNQHSMSEQGTGNAANVVLASQGAEEDRLMLLLDIEAFGAADCEPDDWRTILGRIASLRDLKNLVFRRTLSEKCLNLFQP